MLSRHIKSAYLARIGFAPTDPPSVALCLVSDSGEDLVLVKRIGEIFRTHAPKNVFLESSFALPRRKRTCRAYAGRSIAMSEADSCVTIHMVASLDGFIARKDGSVDWLETSDEFADGETMPPGFIEEFLKTIDCYVMGSRTYELALAFEAQGFGWTYGDKPTFVLTTRELPRTRDTVEFYSGNLAQFVNGRLRPKFRSIWFVGGGELSGECLRLGLAERSALFDRARS